MLIGLGPGVTPTAIRQLVNSRRPRHPTRLREAANLRRIGQPTSVRAGNIGLANLSDFGGVLRDRGEPHCQ